jgi:hypothetical protein
MGNHPIDELVLLPPVGLEKPGLVLVAMGTQAVKLAWECQASWASGAVVVVVPSLNAGADAVGQWRPVLVRSPPASAVATVLTIEDDAGALRSLVSRVAGQLGGQHAGDSIAPDAVVLCRLCA